MSRSGTPASRVTSEVVARENSRRARRILAVQPHAADEIVTAGQRLDEARNVRRIALQIDIHRDEIPSARVFESGGEGGMLAEVGGELDDAHPRIDGLHAPQRLDAVVGRPVINVDHLSAALEAVEHGGQRRLAFLDELSAVEDRHDHGYARAVHEAGRIRRR